MKTISEIKRLFDNKIFKFYFRSGISSSIVTVGHTPNTNSWWINPIDDEELCLQGIDENTYEVIKVLKLK